MPLHGELSTRDQDAAVARYGQQVVVSTNVAETSVTIDGIRLVIDSGLARIARTILIEESTPCSSTRSAALRRSTDGPGWAHRAGTLRASLVPAGTFRAASPRLPEIKRLELAEVVLTLKASGVEDLRKFRWLEAPDERAGACGESCWWISALQPEDRRLGCFRALPESRLPSTEEAGALAKELEPRRQPHSDHVSRAADARLPVHPRYARMLLAAQEFGCVYQACLVAALTQDATC